MHERVVEQDAGDLEHSLLVTARTHRSIARQAQLVIRGLRDAGELADRRRRKLAEVELIDLEVHPSRIEPREVEQVLRELRQPPHLVGHRLQELAPCRLVELLVLEQLDEAAEREQRRAQLVGRVRHELAARPVEAGELDAHAVEGP